MISRRHFMMGMAATALSTAFSGMAWASSFPDRPVRMVVMIGPGSGTDVLTRAISEPMGKQLGSPVVVENKEGAGGTIGTGFVAGAPADGYTILVTNGGHYASAWQYENLSYDPQKDLIPVAQFAQSALVVYVSAESPFKSLDDIITAARNNPATLNYSAVGVGSASHLAGAMLTSMADIDLQYVPYKSSSQAVIDVIGGQVDVGVHGFAATVPLIEGGKIRPIAVTSLKRSSLLPDVPTLDELGVKGYEFNSPIFVLAPAGTPDDVVQKLSAAITSAAVTPEFQKACEVQGLDVVVKDPAELGAVMPVEFEKSKQLLTVAGVLK